MSGSQDRVWRRLGVLGVIASLILAVVGCTTGPAQTAVPSVATPTPSDPFAGLPYRLALPVGWIVMGSSVYDASIDATPDVTAWLKALDLIGPDAFRAYEPLPSAAGLRLAINPRPMSDPTILDDSGAIARLTGVTDEPKGDLVPIGETAKATRFRWPQSIDWGDGTPTSRICVGYEVMSEFEPVTVAFSYPAATDRLAEVEVLMATFEVLASPIHSLAPGATPTPTPTPFDKEGPSTAPTPTHHSDPALEALLPGSIDGVALAKESQTGVELGMTDVDAILKTFGKHPADFARATATSSQPPMLAVGVTRVQGVPGDELQAAMLKEMPDATLVAKTLNGHHVTYVEYGAWPVWFYATGDFVFQFVTLVGDATQNEASATRILALLP